MQKKTKTENRQQTDTQPDKQNKQKNKGKHIALKLTLFLCAAAVLAAGAVFIGSRGSYTPSQQSSIPSQQASVQPDAVFAQKVTVQGVDVSGMTVQQAVKKLQKKSLYVGDCTLTLSACLADGTAYGQLTMTVKSVEAGYTVENMEKQLQTFLAENKSGDYTLQFSIDYTDIEKKVRAFAQSFDKDAVNSTFDGFDVATMTFNYVKGSAGYKSDPDKVWNDTLALLQKKESADVKITLQQVDFDDAASTLGDRMGLISTYSTYSTNNSNGNHNMALAFSRINGATVNNGEVFSFHGLVGDSTTAASGFLPAGALSNGQTVSEYGGGICQCSTTIYGAALRAGLEIVERYNHGIPSSYCPIGQDAAVNYPTADFKFKNNTGYPLYVQAVMDGRTLTVSLYGYRTTDWDEIKPVSWQTQEHPCSYRFEEDASLGVGEYQLVTQGRDGKSAALQLEYYKNGQLIQTVKGRNSYYSPFSYVYKVGPSTDTDLLKKVLTGELDAYPTPTPVPSPSAPVSSEPVSSAPVSSAPVSSEPVSSVPSSSQDPVSSSTASDAASQSSSSSVTVTP